MTTRDQQLQSFLEAANVAFKSHAKDARALNLLDKVFWALRVLGDCGDVAAKRLPICSYLEQVVRPEEIEKRDLQRFLGAFFDLEPKLEWRRREGDCTNASGNFAENHANALIVGPLGMERRHDVWIGVSLIGPNVRYPDHNHSPEETYLIVSGGEFRNDDNDWRELKLGDTFYNSPNIIHAMRTGDQPLLAFWALYAES